MRIHLIPLLQAEEDRDQVRRYWADKAREKELMGAETKVYHSDRCGFLSTWDITTAWSGSWASENWNRPWRPISIIRESC